MKFQEEEHYFGEWTLSEEATEDSKATKERTCEVCSYVEIVEVGADEHFHSYSTEWSKDDENHWYECSCGDKSELGPHTWNDGITIEPATDTKPGQVAYECTICGKQKIVEVDANGHSHSFGSEWKKDASSHWNECGCGEKGNSANHEFGEWQVINDSTESQTGLKERTCQVCSYVESDVIPVKEHTHIPSNDYAFDDIEHWKTCSVCSEVLPKEAHQFGAWETQGETQKRSCNVCGHEESRSLTDTWDGTTVSQSLTGAGNEADPYLINSGADLAYVRDNAASLAGKYLKLMINVDLGEQCFMIPAFEGIFDGNNKTISGLNITGEASGWPGDGVALFKSLEANGTIKNLTVKGYSQGWTLTAGIVAVSKGIVDNCVNYVNVASEWDVGGVVAQAVGGNVTNCANYAAVTGKTNTGGIVGWAKDNVSVLNCKNYGNINAADSAGAGVVACVANNVTVSYCENYGEITGKEGLAGIVGGRGNVCNFNVTIQHCVNEGAINGTGNMIGGIAAVFTWNCNNITIDSCTNKGAVSSNDWNAGGIVGQMHAGDGQTVVVSNCVNEGNVYALNGDAAGIVGCLYGFASADSCTNKGVVTAGEGKSANGICAFDEGEPSVTNCQDLSAAE